jgi:hypothetical protein
MDMLADMLNSFNEFGGLVGLKLSMGRFYLCGCKGQCYINGAQWLKTQAHLKKVVVGRAMECSIVVVLDIRKALIPSTWMCGIVHAREVHDHPIDNLCLSISLRVEGSGFGELGVQQRP